MSGGSFDYAYRSLYLGEIEEMARARRCISDMAESMAREGYPEAAAPLAAILARIDALDAWVQGLAKDGLPNMMKAYEWWQSSDYSEDQFRYELDKYLMAIKETK